MAGCLLLALALFMMSTNVCAHGKTFRQQRSENAAVCSLLHSKKIFCEQAQRTVYQFSHLPQCGKLMSTFLLNEAEID